MKDVGFEFSIIGSIDAAPICQNLIELSLEAEMRVVEEENIKEVMVFTCPARVWMRQGLLSRPLSFSRPSH